MKPDSLTPPGTPVDVGALTVPKAVELANALRRESIDFAELVETRTTKGAEVVVFDVEVELPQVRIHPIERHERIAAVFSSADNAPPEVLALREGFPRVPHLNLQTQELPRSLCLYQEPYRALKRRWTAARFVARVREWLALTAKDRLHHEDQPLEPILMDPDGILFVPSDLLASESSEEPLCITPVRRSTGRHEAGKVVRILLLCPPQTHGVIRHSPQTLPDLAAMLFDVGMDILSVVRTRLRDWHSKGHTLLDANPVLIVQFPKTRTQGGPVETTETWAFQTRLQKDGDRSIPASVRVVGQSLGLWEERDGEIGLLIPPDATRQGEDVLLEVLNPVSRMNRARLAELNNRSSSTEGLNLCAVGVGALGSQVVMNLARAGFGRWTLIDHDLLMPHNVARHLLPGHFVGQLKGPVVAGFANSLTDDENLFTPIPANILTPGGHQTEIHKAFDAADAILDMSASVTVARHLTFSEDSTARRVSLFMSPTGADLVLFAEDGHRTFTLYDLEMQYYRACVHDERLAGHLTPSRTRQRYGQSCNDLTSRLPQHLVALHAAIAAKAILDLLAQPDARIVVWRSHEDGSVTRVDTCPAEAVRMETAEWTVVTDNHFLARIHDLRRGKLPNETGGVLVGSFDLEQRGVYVLDTIPSPPDSEEWPTLYIRGRRGLRARVGEVTTRTGGNLEYVGEWHSHPRGTHTIPSTDDQKVFAWISELMGREGLPALMMIVGDEGSVSCFLAQMGPRENLLPSGGAT